MSTSRVEIADCVGAAFGGGPQRRDQLIAAGRAGGAEDAVVRVLQRLPAGPFRTLRDLWPELPGLPVEPAPPERA